MVGSSVLGERGTDPTSYWLDDENWMESPWSKRRYKPSGFRSLRWKRPYNFRSFGSFRGFRGKRPSRFRAFRGFRGKRWFRPHGFRSFRPSWTYYPRTYFKRSVNNVDKRRGLYSYVTSNDDRRGLYNYYPRYYDKRRGLYSYQYR